MQFTLENVEWIDCTKVSEGYYHGDVLVDGKYAGRIRCHNEPQRVQIYPDKLLKRFDQHARTIPSEVLIPFANYIGLELDSESLLIAFFHSLYIVLELRLTLEHSLIYETARRGLVFVPLGGVRAISILSNPKKKKRLGVIRILNDLPFDEALERYQTFYCYGR